MGMTNRTIRVLCVDDHRLMREGVAKIVGVQPDMEVVAEASNGEHAVAQFLASRPDVTLMDLQLPVASGPEAIRRIRQLDDSARIIALTMYRGDEDIHRAFDAGAMGYVLKDTISDDLIHVIREVHAGRSVVTPDIQQALEVPRFLSGRFAIGEARDTLHIEARFPQATLAELERRGHLVNRWGDWDEHAGHAHGITVDPGSGLRIGGSDPRSDGAAIGY